MDIEIRRKILEELFQMHKLIHESPPDIWDEKIDEHIAKYQLLLKKVTPDQKQMFEKIADTILNLIGDLEKSELPPSLEYYAKIIAQTTTN